MAVVKRRPVPKTGDAKTKVAETKAVEEVKETKATPKTTEKKATEKKAETKTSKAKATPKTTEKKVAEKKETKTSKAKNLDLSKKVAEPRVVEMPELGSLKRDDLIFMLKDRLASETYEDENGVEKLLYDIELGTLENASRVLKCFETILGEALDKSNTVHLCGRNFNRKKVKARVFNPPIGGGAYLVLPHYKMAYVLENSENIKGQLADEGFVAEDGTVYTDEMIEAMNVEFFGEE